MAKLPKIGGKGLGKAVTEEVAEQTPPTPPPAKWDREPLTLLAAARDNIKKEPMGPHGELSLGQKLALMKIDAAMVLLRVT